MNEVIYLDNNATTKIDPRVLEAMMPFLTNSFGNASSSHEFGLVSNRAVKQARESVASLIGAAEHEIIFTSGATEAINLALQSAVKDNVKPHIITCITEHPAVLDTCKFLEQNGVEVSYLSVSEKGLINLEELKSVIKENTVLVSIMYINNETGVMQPIKDIAKIAHEKNILFMSDGTQAVGKIPINVYEEGIDILCFSGHKFYGPKGVGGLFVRSKRPFKARVLPLVHGGGQEKGLRSGTLNVPGIVGLGKACEVAQDEMKKDQLKISKLRNYLEEELLKIERTKLNGDPKQRIYTTSSISFEGADADALIVGLKNIALSNGSACSSTSVEPSHVLKAMGRTDTEAFSTLRFSLGKFNTDKDIQETISKVKHKVAELRQMV